MTKFEKLPGSSHCALTPEAVNANAPRIINNFKTGPPFNMDYG
jgi:hypothetical protein